MDGGRDDAQGRHDVVDRFADGSHLWHVANAAGAGPAVELIEVSVLGGFTVRAGGKPLDVQPVGSQRLLAFLALHDRAVARLDVARRMWPGATDQKASDSLRSALSRLDAVSQRVIVSASAGLRLAETVTVDLRCSQALARRLLRPEGPLLEADVSPTAISSLSQELLPGWHDDWVVDEAEDWRQLRVDALEEQVKRLTAGGRLAGAAGAARVAIRVAPLRESAHASLVRVHLAEGNQSEALRVFERYRTLLHRELGLEPTELLTNLVVGLRRR